MLPLLGYTCIGVCCAASALSISCAVPVCADSEDTMSDGDIGPRRAAVSLPQLLNAMEQQQPQQVQEQRMQPLQQGLRGSRQHPNAR